MSQAPLPQPPSHPILWSFRRCPYAMRARLGIVYAGLQVELREIKLKDKPPAFLAASPSATVPNLQAGDLVLDESLDIMHWALGQSDPQGLLEMPDVGNELIDENDGPFKSALDHTKYAVRYPDLDPQAERAKAAGYIQTLNARLAQTAYLTGDAPKLADLAIFPFVRQFAHIDRGWFDAQPWPHVIAWLDGFLNSAAFQTVMTRFAVWEDGGAPYLFGNTGK